MVHRSVPDFVARAVNGASAGLSIGHLLSCSFTFWTGLGIRSFQKIIPIFAFFSVLYKRMFRSLRSFPFFIKEHSDLSFLLRSL